MSESTVGRILADLMRRGMVLRYAATTKPARKRRFTGHAQRWSYGLLPKAPGEMVQIDHMTVTRNDVAFKPFQARDPMTKYTHADVYHLAEIRDFLKKATRTYNHYRPHQKLDNLTPAQYFAKLQAAQSQML